MNRKMYKMNSSLNMVYLFGIFCVGYLFFVNSGSSTETFLSTEAETSTRIDTLINSEPVNSEPVNSEPVNSETNVTPLESTASEGTKSMCDKWVVITTINYPTEHVKYMRETLEDWCIVVLGDRKTPADWEYKKIYYLSLDDQLQMSNKFKLIAKIPENSYLRKIVGYLYAMDHGARVIYETDDDNAAQDALTGFRYGQFDGMERDCSETGRIFINPYSYFGQTSIWPRGYPLEDISENNPMTNCTYRFVRVQQVPLIQQGLVNGDPDVDAIYRLTRKQNGKLLYVEFDPMAPKLVLNRGQYAPLNSQNTYFHYDSFWTLVFPLNVTFRECDILRGYIAIRLLQEIDGRVGFWPPNAVQIRNAHSYFKDYMEEKRLYEKIGEFVRDLDEWKCESERLDDCTLDLIGLLIKRGHFDQVELDFYRTWLQDLNTLGYKWPRPNRNVDKSTASIRPKIYHKSIEQPHSSNSNDNEESEPVKRARNVKVNQLKQRCGLNFTPDDLQIASNQIRNISLITVATSQNQLEYINNFLGLNFERIVTCMTGSDVSDMYLNQFVSETTGMTIIQAETFAECLNVSVRLYDKQNMFLAVKNVMNFTFWLKDVKAKEANWNELVDKNQTFLVNRSQKSSNSTLKTISFDSEKLENEQLMKVYCDAWIKNESLIQNILNLYSDDSNNPTK